MRVGNFIRASLAVVFVGILVSAGIYSNRGVPDFRELLQEKTQVLYHLGRSIVGLSPYALAVLCSIVSVVVFIIWRKKTSSSVR